GWKLIFDHEDKPLELYDLENDALEKKSVLKGSKKENEELAAAFSAWRREIEQGQEPLATEEAQEVLQTDPELLERLQALGYME
ncbi:MAG: hypothetical protein JRG91_18305, partial [Deltaproteobacteria bacterium]|nr:hypothetical protein [Deltaproteobacteria bacterium]